MDAKLTTARAKPGQRALNRAAVTQRILEAAREAFVENGLTDADLVWIARRAKVGRATLYRYFDGRMALLRALRDEDWDKQAAIFQRLVDEPVIDRSAIEAWLRRLLKATLARATSLPIYSALGDGDSMLRLRAQRERLMDILGVRLPAFAAPADGSPAGRVEGLLLMFEIEQFAAHAAIAPDRDEIDRGVAILADRMAALLPKTSA